MPFFACFSLFRSYIARYAPLKKEKNILKKFYKNFKDINLNNFLVSKLWNGDIFWGEIFL